MYYQYITIINTLSMLAVDHRDPQVDYSKIIAKIMLAIIQNYRTGRIIAKNNVLSQGDRDPDLTANSKNAYFICDIKSMNC